MNQIILNSPPTFFQKKVDLLVGLRSINMYPLTSCASNKKTEEFDLYRCDGRNALFFEGKIGVLWIVLFMACHAYVLDYWSITQSMTSLRTERIFWALDDVPAYIYVQQRTPLLIGQTLVQNEIACG